MEFQTFGDGGTEVLFLMGWGNRLDGENERWFIDRLTAAGYMVHAAQLPTNISEFEAAYLEPVREYQRANALQIAPIIGHSTGGLVCAHLQSDAQIYLSPWWEFYGLKLRARQLDLVSKLPTAACFIPIDFEQHELGAHVTDDQWARLPKRISPAFVREIRAAQETMPEIASSARVFCSLQDTIVGLQGIGAAVRPEQVTLYDGRHELFSSANRAENVDQVVDELDQIA